MNASVLTVQSQVQCLADSVSQLAESQRLLSQPRQPTFAAPPQLQTAPSSQPNFGPQTGLGPLLPVPHLGESTVHRVFPWVTADVADLVYSDRLPPTDLGKLRSPANPLASTNPNNASTTVMVGDLKMVVANSTSGAPLQGFLKALPDAISFAQAWTVYETLRTAANADRSLAGTSSGQFPCPCYRSGPHILVAERC